MKLNLLLLVLVSLVLVYSCQKQVNWNVDPVTSEITGDSLSSKDPALGLLVKTIATAGNQWMQTEYTYDSLKRLRTELIMASSNGPNSESFSRFYRDSAGKVTRIATTIKGQADSAVIIVNYDDYYTNVIHFITSNYVEQAKPVKDSLTATYDGNGNIAILNTYRKEAGGYKLNRKTEYSYVAGNVVKKRVYEDSSSTGIMVLANTYHFSYDNRINPLQLPLEGLLKNKPEAASVNNVTAITVEDRVVPANSRQVESKIFYGGAKKPLSCTLTRQPLGEVTQVQFFYQ